MTRSLLLTEEQLRKCLPRVPDVEIWTAALNEAMARFDITTAERMAAFLAQVGHESSDCRRLLESLDYYPLKHGDDKPPQRVLDLGSGDLNDAMRRSDNWTHDMGRSVDLAVGQTAGGFSVSR